MKLSELFSDLPIASLLGFIGACLGYGIYGDMQHLIFGLGIGLAALPALVLAILILNVIL